MRGVPRPQSPVPSPGIPALGPGTSRRRRRDRGLALVVVLFLSAILTLIMYAFLREMQVESHLAASFGRRRQAYHLCRSAMEKAMATLEAEQTPVPSPSSTWFDSADEWYEQEVSATDPQGRTIPIGVWSMIRAGQEPDGKNHFGIADESSRLSLNLAPRAVLMKLPNMTDEIADAILDWRDSDENVTGSGAENTHYQSQDPPYSCKNGNFDTVEELLYVKGVTPELLYGEDLNQNGVLDPNENDGETSPPNDNSDGVLDLGWISFLTVHSYDKNVRADGQPRVDINSANANQLQQALGDVLTPQELQNIPVRRNAMGGAFLSSAHLMTVPIVPQPGISVAKWRQIVDRVTVADGETLPGLVNINTAGRTILGMLPGLTSDDVAELLEHRTKTDVDLSTIGWLADVLAPDKIQGIAAYVTTRAWQFRFDVVARIGPKSERDAGETTFAPLDPQKPPPPPRAMMRLQAVWDRGGTTPRLLWMRDLTRLGMAYPVQEPDTLWTTGS